MTERLDAALAARGLAASREKAKAAVVAGSVFVNGAPAKKPSTPVGADDVLEVRGPTLRYVGRGGLKLECALAAFGLDVARANCVDLGASTGGFTDCLLQHGAARVVAVDVGHGQLDPRLTADPRVMSLEGTDARDLDPAEVGGPFDVAVTDVSFIPLGKILPAMARLLRAGGAAVCLVKPQFEVGPEHVGKRGVVKDPRAHETAIARVLEQARVCGLAPRALDHSPITGGEGNIEYLLYALREGASAGECAACGGAAAERNTAYDDTTAERGATAGEGAACEGATRDDGTLDVHAVVTAAHAAFGRGR